MKLYYSPGACSMAVHIALEELSMKHELVPVDLRGDRTEYLKVNPKGYVPALMTDKDGLFTEVAVLLQYLADQKPEMKMIPKWGTPERYRAMEMLNFIATEIHKGFGPLWAGERLVQNKEGLEQVKTHTIARLGIRFDALAGHLAGKKFLMGDDFTVCDAYLFTILTWTQFHKMDMSKWPAILGYMERVSGRPAVQKTMKLEFGK